ncbi:MAG: phosphotriesterase [Bacillota bacterium]
MPHIQTVLGDIAPDQLGVTNHHEHIISAPPKRITDKDPDLILDSVDKIVEELGYFKAAGGKTICDATAIDYGRDIRATAEASRRSGVQIIATTGFNKGLFFEPWIEQASIEELTEIVVRDVTVGIDGTAYKAGQVKFGTAMNVIKPVEEKAARAVCRAQRRTGAPLFTHTEAGTMGLEQIEIIGQEGVNTERVCIGHNDRNPDLWYWRQLAASGVYVSVDQISKVKYHPDQVRIDMIIEMVRLGYQQKMMLSGDLARRSYLTAYGGGPGFGYILGKFVPRLRAEMLERGFAPSKIESVIEDLLINNPRRFFTFED